MLDFIKENIYSIVVVLIFLIGLFYLYVKGKVNLLKKIILTLVVEAEQKLGSGTGNLKYEIVIVRIYEWLPKILRLLITKKQLDLMIEEAVDYLKVYLSVNNKNLLSYSEEKKIEQNWLTKQ